MIRINRSVLILIWFIEGTVLSRFRQNIRRDGTLQLEICLRERYCVCSSRLATRLTVFNIHTCYQYLHMPRGCARPTDSPHPGVGVNSPNNPEPRIGQGVRYVPVTRSVNKRLNLKLGESGFLGSSCMLRESSPCDCNRWWAFVLCFWSVNKRLPKGENDSRLWIVLFKKLFQAANSELRYNSQIFMVWLLKKNSHKDILPLSYDLHWFMFVFNASFRVEHDGRKQSFVVCYVCPAILAW